MTAPANQPATHIGGMRLIRGGEFAMGSERFYPEERPLRRARVSDFWIDETPVTNQQFAAFVAATGYRTFAEIAPDPAAYPGLLPELAQAGSLLFMRPPTPVDMRDAGKWWIYAIGADWQHPLGPASSLDGLHDHPVVHVAYQDAQAYAAWAGKELPSEAEWEYAARGGLDGVEYAWGEDLAPEGRILANYWQGRFPWENTLADGYERTSPVRSFPANGHGLYDMIGNVWEWTSDWYVPNPHRRAKQTGCRCTPTNPRGAAETDSYDPDTPAARIGRRVLKGGSHLCAENYCQRYRPAARYPQPVDTTTSHVGFRCIVRCDGS